MAETFVTRTIQFCFTREKALGTFCLENLRGCGLAGDALAAGLLAK